MKIKIYTVRDSKAGAYLQPFFMTNDALVMRTLANCRNEEGHAFNVNPEDYDCFSIGDFDDNTGEISSFPPVHLAAIRHLSVKE